MNYIEVSGKTLEEALRIALIQLGVEENEVNYTVLEEGTKGFLGLGAKEYKIRVEKIADPLSEIETFVSNILKNMGLDCTLKLEQTDDEVRVEIFGDDVGIIIGKHGTTLDSLQYLTNLVVNKKFDKILRVRMDTGGYRAKRLEVLENMAQRLAARVRKTRKAVALEPMNAYERRVIHTYLQKEMGIGTKSEGSDPDRYVVIFPDRGGYRRKNFNKNNNPN